MTTSTDIANRALQLLGTRTTIASLVEQSNEAIQANVAYAAVTDWCHAMANWNFARKQIQLGSPTKTVNPTPPWTTSSPPPPWLYEYAVPADFIKGLYVGNSTLNQAGTAFTGEPQRFVIVSDGGVPVVLTNQDTNPSFVYTARISDPTQWPPFFERFAVVALARAMCMGLSGHFVLLQLLEQHVQDTFTAAEYQNRVEGLVVDDKTPEWIQALGIPYPYRRYEAQTSPFDRVAMTKQQGQQNGNRR